MHSQRPKPQPLVLVPNQNQSQPASTGPQPPPQYAQGGPTPAMPPPSYPPPYSNPSTPAFPSPVYQSTLYLLDPVKRIELCREGEMTLAVDETGRRLFNMVYSSYVHHTAVHSSGTGSHTHVWSRNSYNFKFIMIDCQANAVVSTEFPDSGGAVVISVGDRMIGIARVPSFQGCQGPRVKEVSILAAVPGNPNSFGFYLLPPGFVAQVYRRLPTEVGPRRPLRTPTTSSDIVATMDLGGQNSQRKPLRIDFVDPELDVEGKILILALAQHVK